MIDQSQIAEQWWKMHSRKVYMRMFKLNMRIMNVAQCLAAGGDPMTDPSVKDDYFYLVSEYGEAKYGEQHKAF